MSHSSKYFIILLLKQKKNQFADHTNYIWSYFLLHVSWNKSLKKSGCNLQLTRKICIFIFLSLIFQLEKSYEFIK